MAETRDPTLGPGRRSLCREDPAAIEGLRAAQRLVVDTHRTRSNYFDGRFLAARDLVREQNYSLLRQAELAERLGGGVLRGLEVARLTPTILGILAGLGITGVGEVLRLPNDLNLDLSGIPEFVGIDVAKGVVELSTAPASERSGLFALVLHPVEFTQGSATVYPTTIRGSRGYAAGEIQEGILVGLMRLSTDSGGYGKSALSRSQLAHSVFVHGKALPLPAVVLPLAALWLERGMVRWIDPYLLRREIQADHGRGLGLGLASRALRAAHLRQYQHQLDEELAHGHSGFAASEVFRALPAAGTVPTWAIDLKDFTQSWFPVEISVTLSVIPDREVPRRIEEARCLDPIDLTRQSEELDFTRVDVLIPLSAKRIADSWPSHAPQRIRTIPLLPGRRSARDALALLTAGVLPEPTDEVSTDEKTDALVASRAADATWRSAMAASSSSLFWYVRARSVELNAALLFADQAAQPADDDSALAPPAEPGGSVADERTEPGSGGGVVGSSRSYGSTISRLANSATGGRAGSRIVRGSRESLLGTFVGRPLGSSGRQP